MATRRRPPSIAPGRVDGRPASLSGAPGERNAYARAPRLQELRESAGVTLEQASEILRDQGGVGRLRGLEAGEALPRIAVSRITAALGDAIGNKELISNAEAKEGFE